MNNNDIAKGQRVSITHQAGTETGSVYYVWDDQVHVRMDDGTICWFPDHEVTIVE